MAHPPHSPGFLALVKDAKSRVREFTIEEYRARLARGEAWVLIDTREDHEWEAGHLPDAIHISKGIIEREIERAFPDQATPLVLQCGGGFRSALAADNLQKMGYTNVVSLDGGYTGWVQRGLPVEKG
ncbi:MAG: sulfurtransferase [Candidatus Eisenbacteria bacterium]|uniref:Sulfurtransferase n=1 Tax=Eiseniibacteriota bacterium TaxID=2212470 RepID=A0A538U109_UNCEI|nr:MAG: sulfurtransferase [Candidatus Eisenbacteria bacterium]